MSDARGLRSTLASHRLSQTLIKAIDDEMQPDEVVSTLLVVIAELTGRLALAAGVEQIETIFADIRAGALAFLSQYHVQQARREN